MKTKGFTLIELLAVIIILGLIAIITIPKINKQIDQSKSNIAKTSTQSYIKVIDEYFDGNEYRYNKEYEKILRRCANRDSVPQFFNGIYDESCSYYNGRVEVSNQDFLGIVLDYDKKTKLATIEQRNYFKIGDNVEIFGPKHNIINKKIDKIMDEDGNFIDIVRHPRQVVKIKIDAIVYKDDMMRIK